jgi:hypothetical protein
MSLLNAFANLGRQYNKTLLPMKYNGYTIELDRESYIGQRYMFYKTSEGIDHDADLDGEDYKYCGNCKWADSIQDAKNAIDELCLESGLNVYQFETGSRGAYSIIETVKVFGDSIQTAMDNLEEMINSKDYRLISITK